MIEPCWLDLHDICAIHGEILAESGGTSGILNEGSLDSTINKPKNLYFYSDRKATLYELAASLESQDKLMEKLVEWLKANSEII
jgi:death-on-curing protein